MQAIDKLTLELLTNKTQYKKYLSREDPKRFQENKDYLEKIKKNKSKIIRLTIEFLENPEKQFTTELNDMFLIFGKTMIKYIELKAIERENLYNEHNNDSEEDDEILFDTEQMEESDNVEQPKKSDIFDMFSLEKTLPIKRDDIQSFWGKQIRKNEIIENTVLDIENKQENQEREENQEIK
jgi:hypothetical protein